jgi:hypothetical protein
MAASIHQLKARVADQASAERQGSASPLHDELQFSFRRQIAALLERFFDAADDRLFEYGERAGGTSQLDYLHTMRSLRAQRDAVQQRFMAAVTEQLRPGWKPQAVAGTAMQSRDLKLIEDELVEQRLAVETTRQRIESHCETVLFEFKQRLASARRQFGLQLLDAQFAPGALCLALYEGLQEIDIKVDLLVVVLKIFEQVARTDLRVIYTELNTLLDAHGAAGESPALPRPALPDSAAGRNGPPREGTAAAPGVVPPTTASLAIRALAANAAAFESLLRAPRTAAAPAQQSLDAALSEMISAARNPAPPQWVSAAILRAAASSWLFDEILGDSNIPPSLHGDLDGLRAPFVRASLLEEGFVSDAAHPLRKLIQDLALLAASAKIGGPEEVCHVRGIVAEVGARLEGLMPRRDLHATSSVDEPTVQSFTDAVREATRLRRDRLIKSARERSTEIVNHGVERHLAAIELPAPVSQVLEKVFGPLLGLVLLRSGGASPCFAQARALLDEFLGTVAHGLAGAPSEAGFAARVVRAVASIGFSAVRQGEVRALVETAFGSGPLLVQAQPSVPFPPAAAAHHPRHGVEGVEVSEISCAEIESCARELFVPGNWFHIHTTDNGGETRWMQVERCLPEQGQVAFTGLLGAQSSVRQLQKLIFEVLSGQCEHVTGNPQPAGSMARLAAAFGGGIHSAHAV